MNKEEIEIWNKYNKFKSVRKKTYTAEGLKFHGGVESLDKLSEEFLNIRSAIFRNDAMEVIEYLELKLNPNRNELSNYDKLLKFYKIQTVQNFWFKANKKITISTLEEEMDMFIEKSLGKYEPKTSKFNCEFPITPNLTGILQLSIIPTASSYDLNHLTYGFYSNYRDIGGGLINSFPHDQFHLHTNNTSLFSLARHRIPDYARFLQNHESELLMVAAENPIQDKYFKDFCKQISFNDELWFMLSLINIQKRNNQFDKMKRTAQLGIKIQGDEKAGFGWLKYYQNKLTPDSGVV